VLKKTFKAATALLLLVGCYRGYVHAFAVLVEQFRVTRRVDVNPFVPTDSRSKRVAIELAKSHFGDDHWSAREDLMFRYYNAERGFWMYAKEVVRVVEQDGVRYDGKRVTMAPFALIWLSPDGRSAKTILSDRAVFDLNEPLSLSASPGGNSLKIKHAWIQENVLIRDNHGTPQDPADDMNIGPLTALEYDEPTLQIRTASDVVIQDRDMRVTGVGMLIQLRAQTEASAPGHSSAGFQGAETLYLHKNVDVVMRDVGSSGILPGKVQTKQVAPGEVEVRAPAANQADPKTAARSASSEPTPLHVHCDSTMRVDMPKPQNPVPVGPPQRPAPTLVRFERNVVVLRGPADSQRDQLNCDALKLTLIPDDKATKKGTETKSESQPQAQPTPPSGPGEENGPLGNLTLQRAHATGHAVWLYLPAQGVKLRCNELIHMKWMGFKPDVTYFRGDLTRPIELTKVDVVHDEGPDKGKVTSVTNIRCIDATMLDSGAGNGLDTANVIAHGPGRLETRPDRDQPVERIAVWQDQLDVQNVLEPDGHVKQKIIVLSGSRPCFIDALQKTSLDSASTIWVWLKPKPASAQETGKPPTSRVGVAMTETTAATPVILASRSSTTPSSGASTRPKSGDDRGAGEAPADGGFRIDRLMALRDVHLLAPSKTLTARERLDAEFVDAEPTPVEPPKAGSPSSPPATHAEPPQTQPPAEAQGQSKEPATGPNPDPVAAQKPAEPEPTEPPMTGSAQRIWAKIAQSPGSNLGAGSTNRSTKTTSAAAAPGSNAEVRKVWMTGNVALHQDPGPGKTKGQEASGEAVYVDNRGKGKAHTIVYQRDPNEKTRRPGPLPPARVENDDNKISVLGFLTMNQETDQVWANGPGSMTQMAARGFMSEKPGDKPADAAPVQKLQDGEAVAKPKPKKRAGVELSDRAPMTITFTDRMEFNGRSTHPDGFPSARADFYGIVNAKMEDGLLHCEEQMITFTDKAVPLAQLGTMSKSPSKPKSGGGAADPANEDVGPAEESEKPKQAELARIYCYKRAIAITRKVDPDSPILIQKQKIYADDSLVYDHLTGEFEVPKAGFVSLYDRGKEPSNAPDQIVEGGENGHNVPNRSATGTRSRTTARPTPPATKPKAAKVPPLVLTQIHFAKGMVGQYRSPKPNDKTVTEWSEFFGDIQVARAQVPDERSFLNLDKLPRDGSIVTGQFARVVGEPPPATAPPSTPVRHFVKVWDRATLTSIDKTLSADAITYDTYKELFFAYSDPGRQVIVAEQHAPGQAASSGTNKALQFNPKTGAVNATNSNQVMLLDKKTGLRPGVEMAADPFAKPKKPYKKPYRTPPTNVDRRNFTGQ
jgi:hypothetical protein